MAGRFLVGAGGADENKLAGPAAEQTQVPFNILRSKGNPIHDCVEFLPGEQPGQVGFVAVHIAHQQVRAFRQRIFAGLASIENEKFDAAFQGQFRTG